MTSSNDEMKKIQELMYQIHKSLYSLEYNYSSIRKDLDELTRDFHYVIKKMDANYKQIIEEYEEINRARLEVIQEQKNAINAFIRGSLTERIKTFFRPRIATLYHYEPRQLFLRKHHQKKIFLSKIPTITLVTPSFKHGRFIERTIMSVLEQEYPALEYIIQDGGSKDETLEIIERYKQNLKHWESKEDNGQSHALNRGFQHATGEIMAYLNSDDMLLPGTLFYVADFFTKNPHIDVVYGQRIMIDEYDQEVGRWVLPPHDSKVLLWADYVPQETLFWRRSIWEKIGGYVDESFKFAMDWDLLLRFKESGAKFKRLPRFLGAFRGYLVCYSDCSYISCGTHTTLHHFLYSFYIWHCHRYCHTNRHY